ncbi:MAG: hypothetical protein QOF76_4759 [Solirubrobacteraceae bacterium]|jgi:carbon monoxide dehydrogenase subunit G|nr:hypothetical protein [Solirubrobacteraceae bacterium]
MSEPVKTDINIKASPETVWETIMDAHKLGDWVTIHRKLNSVDDGPPTAGMEMKQTLSLRGTKFKVEWELTECETNQLAVWKGKGPMRSHARTEYHLSDDGNGGTDFHYVNEFKAPGGVLGKTASSVLVGGLPKKEAEKSLQQLKRLLEK